jgi:hypothetical protein
MGVERYTLAALRPGTKAGCASGSVRTGTENIASTRIRFPDRQDRSFLITSLINYSFTLKRSVIIVSLQEQQNTLHRQSNCFFSCLLPKFVLCRAIQRNAAA